MCILRFEEQGTVVGFCPLMRRRRFPVDHVFFLGHPTAGHMDFLLETGSREAVIATFVKYQRTSETPSLFILKGCSEASPNYICLRKHLADEGIPTVAGKTKNYFIDLRCGPTDFGSYYEGRFSKDRRYATDKKEQRLQKLAPLLFRPAEPTDLSAVFELHKHRRRVKFGRQEFSEPNARAFYTELLSLKSSDFSASLDVLSLGPRILSFIYSFRYRDEILLKRIAHDDLFHSFSPGSILLRKSIDACFGATIRTISFGVGEDAYKENWTDRWHAIDTLMTASDHMASRMALSIHRWILLTKSFLKKDRRRAAALRRIAEKSVSFFRGGVVVWVAKQGSGAIRHTANVVRMIVTRSNRREHEVHEIELHPQPCHGESFHRPRYADISDIESISSFTRLPGNAIIARMEQDWRCIVIEQDGAIVYAAWINPREIRLPGFVGVKTLRGNMVFLWETFMAKGISSQGKQVQDCVVSMLWKDGYRRLCFLPASRPIGWQSAAGTGKVKFQLRRAKGRSK